MAKNSAKPHKNKAAADSPPKTESVSKSRKKRTPDQRLKDLETIAEMRLQGMKQSAIADHLNLTQQQISYDLREVKKRWASGANIAYDEHVAQELAKLELLEREYWAAWKRSQQPRKNTLAAVRERQGTSVGEKEAKEETRDGNPRFLEGVLFVMERRARLVGLDKPTRVTGTLQTYDLTQATDEQLTRLAAGESLESVFGNVENTTAPNASNSRDSATKKAASRRAQNAPRRSKRS